MSDVSPYIPLRLEIRELAGLHPSLEAMRLPKGSKGDTPWGALQIGPEDAALARRLVLAGDDEGKFSRGIMVYLLMHCQLGWAWQYVTYRWGVECLSSSSTMHGNLRGMHGAVLAAKKQADLTELVYVRSEMVSYQAFRRMYLARRHHRHPDWKILCNFVEKLPYFDQLIYPEQGTTPSIRRSTIVTKRTK